MEKHLSTAREFLREIIFGFNDGLVSIFGLTAGLIGAYSTNSLVALAGTIGAIAAAISMSLGNYISTKSQNEAYVMENKEKKNSGHKHGIMKDPIKSSLIMFFAFIVGSAIPVIPYIFSNTSLAFLLSTIISLAALLFVGMLKGFLTGMHWFKSGAEMLFIGALAFGLSYYIGTVIGGYFGVIV